MNETVGLVLDEAENKIVYLAGKENVMCVVKSKSIANVATYKS